MPIICQELYESKTNSIDNIIGLFLQGLYDDDEKILYNPYINKFLEPCIQIDGYGSLVEYWKYFSNFRVTGATLGKLGFHMIDETKLNSSITKCDEVCLVGLLDKIIIE